MKLIVGLGNPGKKYANNRHNLGFMVVDGFAKDSQRQWYSNDDLMCFYIKSDQYILIKPTTYMNKSGESVLAVCNFFKIAFKDILVVHDDLDLDFGKIRLVFNSRSAGHHGVEGIIESLGTVDFARLRIGIGHPKSVLAEKYVLSDLSSDETKQLSGIIKKGVEAVHSYIDAGLEATMNRFN